MFLVRELACRTHHDLFCPELMGAMLNSSWAKDDSPLDVMG